MLGRLAAASVLAGLAAAASGVPGAGATPDAGTVRLAIAGDTHGYHIVDNPALEGSDLLGGVRPVLGKADLFLFNHEGTLIDPEGAGHCRTFGNQSTFATPPEFAERLDAGVPMVAALANNHQLDCGTTGLMTTLKAFAEAGVATVGAGINSYAACAPLTLHVHGVSIAIVSYLDQDPATIVPGIVATPTRPGVATYDGCDVESTLAGLSGADVVIVMLHAHWGSSWVYGASEHHVGTVEQLLAWGADVVVSSGPHLPQGVMTSGPAGTLALMGVGDFMFQEPGGLPLAARASILTLLNIADGRASGAWLYPTWVGDDGLPELAAPDAARDLLELIDSLSAQFGSAILRGDSVGQVRTSSGPPARAIRSVR